MTKLLETAFSRVRDLQDDEQDYIAALMLAELEDEREWDRQFAESPDLLAELAREAMAGVDALERKTWPSGGAGDKVPS